MQRVWLLFSAYRWTTPLRAVTVVVSPVVWHAVTGLQWGLISRGG